MPNGDYEGDIGPLNEKIKADFEARPDRAELEAKYNMEYGDRSIRPEDLAKPRTHEEYVASLDRALANHAALEAERKAKGQTPAASGSGPGPGYEQAKESFRESLGMDAGPEFDGHVQNLHAWVNETFSSSSEFDKLAAVAEAALGVRGAAQLALQLAQAHARSRR